MAGLPTWQQRACVLLDYQQYMLNLSQYFLCPAMITAADTKEHKSIREQPLLASKHILFYFILIFVFYICIEYLQYQIRISLYFSFLKPSNFTKQCSRHKSTWNLTRCALLYLNKSQTNLFPEMCQLRMSAIEPLRKSSYKRHTDEDATYNMWIVCLKYD